MKCSLLVAMLIVCPFGVSAQCSPQQKTQIDAVREAWKASWDAKQLDGVVSLYAADAVFLPSDGSRNTGTVEIKAALQKQLGSTVAITSVSVNCSGELAYDSGTYTQDFPPNSNLTTLGVGGGHKHVEGQYLVVLKRQSVGTTLKGGLRMSGGMTVAGGRDGFVIVQHAATMKP